MLRFFSRTTILSCWYLLFACGGRAESSDQRRPDPTQIPQAPDAPQLPEVPQPPAARTPLLSQGAWDVTVTARATSDGSDLSQQPFRFTLAMVDGKTELVGILSQSGAAATPHFRRLDGMSAELAAQLSFQLADRHDSLFQLMLSDMTLGVADDDGDGNADHLSGVGHGSVEQSCGDCSYSTAVDLTLQGTPDHTPPALDVPTAAQNPVSTLNIAASEALQAATLQLVGTEQIPLLPLEPLDGGAKFLTFATDRVLPFSGKWQIDGAGHDFAGLPLDLSALGLTTLADPGVLVTDGFETTPLAQLTGEAAVVDATSGLPIPSGTHALLLPPNSSATFHLRRSTQTTVAATFVALTREDTSLPVVAATAAVIGGTVRHTLEFKQTPTATPTENSTWTSAGMLTQTHAVLSDAGSDVVFSISVADCDGFCLPGGALLLDELHLE